MKRLLIVLSALFLLLLDGCGCSQSIDYVEPMYVSPTEYEKMSCKEIKDEFPYYTNTSCAELKEKLVYISSTEYEALSCKQLHEQLIKINGRLATKSKIETEETVAMLFVVPFALLTTAGVPLIAPKTDAAKEREKRNKEESRRKDAKFDAEVRRLKGEYEALKEIAIKKNCSFAAEMK